MKFTIQKKHLLNGIQAVTNAISSRTVVPILTGMKIDVLTSKIILTGSNSDMTIQSHIQSIQDDEEIITNITPGSIVLPVPHFSDIIRKLPEDIVHISVEENFKTIITSGKAVFTLYGQSSDQYPQVKMDEDSKEPLEIKVKALKKLIRQTVFAVSQMETRPILTGVNVTIKDRLLTFTATDSHRLALRSVPVESDLDVNNIVIPGSSLQELNKIYEDEDDNVRISFKENQVLFHNHQTYFLSRLLSGNYPETDRLIPTETKTKIQIFTKDFIHTIERAALLSNRDQNNVIRLDTIGDNLIQISGNSPEIGNVKEQLDVISIEGEELKISFSSKYMLDTLKTIDSERIEINFTGAMRPFVIRTPEDEHILQLILPVRTF